MEDPLSFLGDYAFLSYDGSHNDPTQLSELKVLMSTSWTHCGPLLSLSEADLPESYRSWSQATLQGNLTPQLFPLLAFAHHFIAKAGLSHYWISIRATKAMEEKASYRWHTDDRFFRVDDRPHNVEVSRLALQNLPLENELSSAGQDTPKPTEWKLLTTLLGPGTVFIKDGTVARDIQRNVKSLGQAHERHLPCSSVQCRTCHEVTKNTERLLDDALSGFEIEKAQEGQVVFIRTGDLEGAMHSVPHISEDRVFVNIIPGTESELRRLTKKYGMEYPRAWNLGVPVRPSWDPIKKDIKVTRI
jgi:hypothetical protein